MYDRCPLCHGALQFYGISIKPTWLRWLECPTDVTFFASTSYGALTGMTKKIPADAYFVQFKDKRD